MPEPNAGIPYIIRLHLQLQMVCSNVHNLILEQGGFVQIEVGSLFLVQILSRVPRFVFD